MDFQSLNNRVVANWIHSHDWGTFATLEDYVNYPLVREFYCNISSVDLEGELIISWVRGIDSPCPSRTLRLSTAPLSWQDFEF